MPLLADVDVIVHLAGRAHVLSEKENDPLSAYRRINVEATRRLAQRATETGVKRFIFVSTIKVNGEQVNIPSYQVKPGDIVSIAEKAKNQLRVKESITLSQEMDLVAVWMEVSNEKMEGTYKAYPDRNDLPTDINENLIVELYSK